jgi:uncharacterized protein (TIGR00255 family)
MLKSMTAYGRAVLVTDIGRFVVEIQSVNRKYLEINASLPRELSRFDSDIRKWVAAAVNRGLVTLRLYVTFTSTAPVNVLPNFPLARQIKSAWEKLALDAGVPKENAISWEILLQQDGILFFEEDIQDENAYRSALLAVVQEALEQLVEMKVREGSELYADIANRLVKLKEMVEKVAEKAPEAPKRYQQKLTDKLNEFLGHSIENEEKILRELCVYADRIDIAEEITRFQSHLKQFDTLISGPQGNVGKTLEFLLQELNREANTIGSKSSEVEVSHLVVEIKTELERIREQIQNVE